MSTGPGLPVEAMWKASLNTRGRSSTDFTRKLCLVKDSQAPVMSASWNTSRPSCSKFTWPVMATMGMESI